MKVWRFEPGMSGRKSTIEAYQREEQSNVEVTHVDSNGFEWLKCYGLVAWAVEPE